MASKMTSLISPIAASFAGAFALHSVIAGAKEAAASAAKFEAVLAATNNAARITTEEMGALASQLQSVTNFEDDATVSAAALLASLENVRGDNFRNAVAIAQDMATVMNVDLGAAVKKLAKELKGLPVEEVEAKLATLQGRFGGAAKAVADPFVKLQNTIGDVGESIGAGLVPVLNSLAETATSWLVPMNELLGSSVGAITRMTQVVIGATVAFVALKVATIAYATYQRLATISAIAFQAVVNPALMLKVAAGIAIAAGTVLAMDAAMTKVAGAAPGVVAGLNDIGDAADGIGDGVKKIEKLSDVGREIQSVTRDLLTEGDERKKKIRELIDQTADSPDPVGDLKRIELLEKLWAEQDAMVAKQKELKDAQEAANKAQEEAAAKALEHKNRTAELNDELAVLAGTMTKQEAAARALERQGFTPEQAAEQAGKQAQLDAAKKGGGKSLLNSSSGAVTAASQEALSIIAKASNASKDPMLAKADKQIKEQEKANGLLANLPEKINKALKFQVADIA